MLDPLKAQKLVLDVQSAEQARNKAALRLEESQASYKKEVITVFEKMSFFSAGIISLSIPFVGSLVPENSNLLTERTQGIPAYTLLYASWVTLVINLILGLAIRWADATYIFFNAQRYWLMQRKDHAEKKLLLNQEYDNLIFSDDTSRENEIDIGNQNVKTYSDYLIPRTQKKETFYSKLVTVLQITGIATFILGIIQLLFFVTSVISGLIYK